MSVEVILLSKRGQDNVKAAVSSMLGGVSGIVIYDALNLYKGDEPLWRLLQDISDTKRHVVGLVLHPDVVGKGASPAVTQAIFRSENVLYLASAGKYPDKVKTMNVVTDDVLKRVLTQLAKIYK